MKKLKKEEIAEDYCFVCKDGGDLRICDYGDCLKSYHPECENKEESFLDSEERWTCRWHQCFMCPRPAKFQCFTCPVAVCGIDFNWSEFAQVRGNKGFCAHCLLLASLVEKNKDVVSDEEGVKVDFQEQATYERYFREYYEIIKEKEGLTAQMTLSAMAGFKQGKQIRLEADNEGVNHSENDGLVSDYDDIGDEEKEAAHRVKKKRKRPSGRTRKNDKSKASKFNGWATKSLISFLNSIGEDATKPLSWYDVDSIIRRYIHLNKLVVKKIVFCDEKLQSLFRKKSVKIRRISSLLESQLAENVVHSDQENGVNASSSDEEDDDSPMAPYQNEKKIISNRRTSEFKNPSTEKSCYAAIVTENIKLIYLKRTLVVKLLKEEPETCKDKLIGSFVRIKSDPYDCLCKNTHQLVKVTGVNEASSSGETRFLLQVSSKIKCIPISEISDEEFSLEECDDLRQRVEAGLLCKITSVDLEQKSQMLHEDVTKHWITGRLAVLQNLIDRANEKGRKRELYEYLEAKDILQTEAEQSRLLHEVPTVIADDINVPPPTFPERIEKPENELPQKFKNESSRFQNGMDSAGGKSSKILEINKLQAKEGSRNEATSLLKFQDPKDPVVVPSHVNIPVVDDSDAIFGDLEQLIDEGSSSRASYPGPHSGLSVEQSSPASPRVCQMKKIFLNCLKLDFPTLFTSINQSGFLESLTTLAKVGDFSPEQISAMENLIYKFPRLSSGYQFAEDTISVFRQFMQSHSSLLEDTKRYIAERKNIEVLEKSVRENSLLIQAEIKQLQLKLKVIDSEKETLFSRKLELASKIKEKNAELFKSSSELDTWNVRHRKAIEERETVLAAWESFKKLLPGINDPMKVSVMGNAEVVQQQTRLVHDSAEDQIDRHSRIWFHFTWSGVQHGPVSTYVLKSWCESSAYATKLKVWKTGQAPDQAIPIADAVRQFFP